MHEHAVTHIQAVTTLNHAGICMSYVQTWAYLRQLSSEARYLDVVKSGNWIWVYDNLNVHKAVRHERQGMRVDCDVNKITM